MRKHPGCQSAPTPASFTTEYRERFLKPRLTAALSAKTHKEYQPRGGHTHTKSHCVTQKLMEHPPMVQKASLQPEGHRAQDDPVHTVAIHILSQAEASQLPAATMMHHSVYQDDFRAWDAHKRQPYKLSDNLKVSPGTFATTTTCKDAYCPKSPVKVTENFKPTPPVRESQPFDGTTNYKSDYVIHPVQLRMLREKPSHQSNSAPLPRVFTTHENHKGLPQEPARSCKPHVTWERNPVPFEGTSEFREKFKTWPLEPKFQRKAEEYIPSTEHVAFLSTTHADYMAHKFQQGRSAQRPVEAWVKKTEPFQTKSTMKEDYRVWDAIRCPPIVHKEELEWSKEEIEKTTTYRSVYTPKSIQRAINFKPTARPLSHSKSMLEDTTTYHSSYNTKPQRISTGAGGHRLYQTTSVDAVGTHPDSGIC